METKNLTFPSEKRLVLELKDRIELIVFYKWAARLLVVKKWIRENCFEKQRDTGVLVVDTRRG